MRESPFLFFYFIKICENVRKALAMGEVLRYNEGNKSLSNTKEATV